MAYEVYLKKNEEKRPLAGHSWVYANEVARIEGKDKNGALATVRSFDGRFVGKGYLNHARKASSASLSGETKRTEKGSGKSASPPPGR